MQALPVKATPPAPSRKEEAPDPQDARFATVIASLLPFQAPAAPPPTSAPPARAPEPPKAEAAPAPRPEGPRAEGPRPDGPRSGAAEPSGAASAGPTAPEAPANPGTPSTPDEAPTTPGTPGAPAPAAEGEGAAPSQDLPIGPEGRPTPAPKAALPLPVPARTPETPSLREARPAAEAPQALAAGTAAPAAPPAGPPSPALGGVASAPTAPAPSPSPGTPASGEGPGPEAHPGAAAGPLPTRAEVLLREGPPGPATPAPHGAPATGPALPPGALAAPTLAAPPASAPAPAPAPLAVQQVDVTLRWMVKGAVPEARLQLQPESLGKVAIELKVAGGEVHAKVWVQEAGALQALQEGRATLEQALRDSGLQLGSFDLQQGGQAGHPPADSGREALPEPHPEPLRLRQARQEAPEPPGARSANPRRIELYA